MSIKNQYAFIKKIRPIELGAAVKKLFRVQRFIHPEKGFLWWIDPASELGAQLLENGCFEPALSDYIVSVLKKGDVFVDLGANEGWFSVLAAKQVGPQGKVIAIEPQERLWPVLIKNFFINQCSNCLLVPCAIGQEEVDQEMILNPELNNGGSSFVGGMRSYFWPRQTTPMRKLDSIFEQYHLQKIDLMKIDIEGYEYFALQSGEKIFTEKKVKKVVVDIHTSQLARLGISPQQIHDFFADKGYKLIQKEGIGLFIAE